MNCSNCLILARLRYQKIVLRPLEKPNYPCLSFRRFPDVARQFFVFFLKYTQNVSEGNCNQQRFYSLWISYPSFFQIKCVSFTIFMHGLDVKPFSICFISYSRIPRCRCYNQLFIIFFFVIIKTYQMEILSLILILHDLFVGIAILGYASYTDIKTMNLD